MRCANYSRLSHPEAGSIVIRLTYLGGLKQVNIQIPTIWNMGWVEVICGSMFSGKTEELIRRVKRAQIAKQKVQIFKPVLDTRYSIDRVTSHSCLTVDAINVQNPEEISDSARGQHTSRGSR